MKNKLIIYDLVLVFLICLSLSLIILFVDFDKEDKLTYNRDVYRTYYLYDNNSNPVSLSYEILEFNKDTDIKKVIKKMLDKLKIVDYNDFIVDGSSVLIILNNDYSTIDKISLDCLVNSITSINVIDEVILKYGDNSNKYTSNISEYYVNSPLQNNLLLFLYRDSNYKLLYKNELEEDNYFVLSKVSDNSSIFNIGDDKYTWKVKRDGIYINDKKILSNTYKVNDTWVIDDNKTATITGVNIDNDDILLIDVSIKYDNGEIKYQLKQGLGITSYTKYENNTLISKYEYVKKKFIKVK